MANPVIIDDWVLADIDEVARYIVEVFESKRRPVVLIFEKPEDFEEYTRPDIFAPAIIDGETCLSMPSSYTDATFLEGRLADMGYRPVEVSYGRVMHYGKDCVMFTFAPEMPEKK